MTKNKLLIAIENYNRGIIHFGTVETAVDSYSSALLQQTPCTTQVCRCGNPDLCLQCGKDRQIA